MKTFNFDAFGNPVQTTATGKLPATVLYSDGVYDPASGFRCNDARWLNGFWFTQADNIAQSPGDLANANLHLYVGGNPITGIDPSGHSLAELLTVMGEYASEFATQVAEVATVYNEGATLKGAADLAEQFVTT